MTKTCSIEGCGGEHRAKGLCSKHYDSQYRQSAAGKAAQRASSAKYHQTPAGKAADKKYEQSAGGKAVRQDPRNRAYRILSGGIKEAFARGYKPADITLEELAGLIEREPECSVHRGTACCNGKSPTLDHNHLTGEVRGWLCSQLNMAEGSLKTASTARLLANYMEADRNCELK